MKMKPMSFGEQAEIILPSGEQIIIWLSHHRSNRDEPIVGFETPQGTMVRRQRLEVYLQQFLQQVQIYQVRCQHHGDAIIVAVSQRAALRCYRKRYPSAEPEAIEHIQDSPAQPLTSYPWYRQLQKLHYWQEQPPFFIEE